MVLPCKEMSGSPCVSGSCLSGHLPKEAWEKRVAHPYAGGQAQDIQDFFGSNNVLGWGLHREEPELGVFGPPRA